MTIRPTDNLASALAALKPGDTLTLAPGVYHQPLTPPEGRSGVEGKPIEVRAEREGTVTFDGEGQRTPIKLYKNDWWNIEGVNACNAGPAYQSLAVVGVSASNHCAIRRVCAWEGSGGNDEIFGVHGGEYNLFEDCAGWGIARKIYQNSYGGNHTTYRRCWGRWEGSTAQGPKMVYSLGYQSGNNLFENCIGTWDAFRMPSGEYMLQDGGKPIKPITGVDQPYGVFGVDSGPGVATMLGCIADVRGDAAFPPWYAVMAELPAESLIEHCLSVADVISTGSIYGPFPLRSCTFCGPEPKIGGYVQTSNIRKIARLRANMLRPDGGNGCELLYRYHDGQLTGTRLWPWPMEQRIADAMRQSKNPKPTTPGQWLAAMGV